VRASRTISVAEPHFPSCKTQPRRQPSAPFPSRPPETPSTPLRRSHPLPLDSPCPPPKKPLSRRHVYIRRCQRTSTAPLELPEPSRNLAAPSVRPVHAATDTDGMTAGPPMGRPGHRRLLRPLQPALDIVAREAAGQAKRVAAQGVADPAGKGRVGKDTGTRPAQVIFHRTCVAIPPSTPLSWTLR
jgi:hypothetical protein